MKILSMTVQILRASPSRYFVFLVLASSLIGFYLNDSPHDMRTAVGEVQLLDARGSQRFIITTYPIGPHQTGAVWTWSDMIGLAWRQPSNLPVTVDCYTCDCYRDDDDVRRARVQVAPAAEVRARQKIQQRYAPPTTASAFLFLGY